MADNSLTEACAALAGWDTPALSNSLERLALRPRDVGFTDASVRRLVGPTMAGVAVTARLEARGEKDNGVPVADLYRAVIAADGPPIVVVQDDDEPAGCGAFLGEVIGNLLSALGVVGFVTNGGVRDLDELRDLGLSVFAGAPCVSRAYVRLTAVGVPVRIAGMDVAPGDVLHGDQHGILQIPREAAARLPAIAEEIREEEQQTVRWARSPEFTPEGLLARRRVRH